MSATRRQARQDSRRDSVEVLRRAVRGDHQPAAGGDDLVHRVEEFFLGRILAGNELDVVDQKQVGAAQPLLEPDGVVFLQRPDELDHELFGRHRDDSSTAVQRREAVTDRVQQVGLAAPGAAMDEEWVEADRWRGRQRTSGGRGDFIGLADDERFEPVARVEVRRRRIALDLGRRFLEDQQRRWARRIRGGDDSDFPNHRENGLPCQCQAIAEVRAHPISHELARHDEIEGAAVGFERAELGRLQPAVKGARTKVTAKSSANRFPCCLERSRDRRFREFNGRIRGTALHWPASPSLPAPKSRQKNPLRRTTSRGVQGSVSTLPPARIRTRKVVSGTVRGSFQVPFFHGSEIKLLDIGIVGKLVGNGRKQPFSWLFLR